MYPKINIITLISNKDSFAWDLQFLKKFLSGQSQGWDKSKSVIDWVLKSAIPNTKTADEGKSDNI